MEIDFSLSTLVRYWDVFREYINPGPIIVWAVIGGAVGTVAMVLLMVIFRKKVFVKRRHWTLKVLSYCYIVALPLIGGFFFTQWFALHKCQVQLADNVPVYLGKTNEVFNIYLKKEIEKVIKAKYLEMSGREMMEKSLTSIGDVVSGYIRETETGIGEKVSAYMMKTGYFREQVIDRVSEKAAELLMTDKELTDELLDIKVREILDSGVFNTIVQTRIHQIFGGFKTHVALMFLLLLVIPVGEIILANYLARKKVATSGAADNPACN